MIACFPDCVWEGQIVDLALKSLEVSNMAEVWSLVAHIVWSDKVVLR